MNAIHSAIMANANDRERKLYTGAKSDKGRDAIVRGVEARIAGETAKPLPKPLPKPSPKPQGTDMNKPAPESEKLPPKAPNVVATGLTPVEPAKPAPKGSKGAKALAVATVNPDVGTAKPVAASAMVAGGFIGEKPQDAAEPVSDGFKPYLAVGMIGGGELCPVEVTAHGVSGKGNDAKPLSVILVPNCVGDWLCAEEGTTVTVAADLCRRPPLAGVPRVENGVLVAQVNATFSGVTFDPSELWIPPTGATMEGLALAITGAMRCAWLPMPQTPSVGEVVRFYDPTAASPLAPGRNRPVEFTVTVVKGTVVEGIVGKRSEGITVDLAVSGSLHACPIPEGVNPMLRALWEDEWSLRCALWRKGARCGNHAELRAIESAYAARVIRPVKGCEALTF